MVISGDGQPGKDVGLHMDLTMKKYPLMIEQDLFNIFIQNKERGAFFHQKDCKFIITKVKVKSSILGIFNLVLQFSK